MGRGRARVALSLALVLAAAVACNASVSPAGRLRSLKSRTSLSRRAQTCRKFADGYTDTLFCGEISFWTTAPNVSYTDNVLSEKLANLVGNNRWPETDEQCYGGVQKLFCMYFYPQCDTKHKKLRPICPSVRTDALNQCTRKGIDLNFTDVDVALGGSNLYGNKDCWDGSNIRNDDELVPVLPGSELEVEAEVEEDLEFEGEIDEEEEELQEEIDELQGEVDQLEGVKNEIQEDLASKTNDTSYLPNADSPDDTDNNLPGPYTPPASGTSPKCTLLDFTTDITGSECPRTIQYTLLPGHVCMDDDNIAFNVDQEQCPCDLEDQKALETACYQGKQTRIYFYDPVQPVGASGGDFGLPAIKECDRRFNLMPIESLDVCSDVKTESEGWTFVQFVGNQALAATLAGGATSTALSDWTALFTESTVNLDGSATGDMPSNRWTATGGKLRIDGRDPGGVATLSATVRVPEGSDSGVLLFAFESLADLPLAGLRVYVDGFKRMQVANDVDKPIGYAVELLPGRDSKVLWEYTWSGEGDSNAKRRRQVGGTQYAALSLVALKGAALVGSTGNLVQGFAAPPATAAGSGAATDQVGVTASTGDVGSPAPSSATAYIVVGTVGLVAVAAAAVVLVRRATRGGNAADLEYTQLEDGSQDDVNEYLAGESSATLGGEDGDGEDEKVELRRLDYFAGEEPEHDEDDHAGEQGAFLNDRR